MDNINLRVLDYDDVQEELKRITKSSLFTNKTSEKTLHDNIPVPYYTLGSGDNHIVICGGTHGSEIISVDFVLRLMDEISKKHGVYENINLEDSNGFTFHFLPLHNPEGYIISTSAIRTVLDKKADQNQIEKISKKYFLNYRKDDINSKKHPLDRTQKEHQKMFERATYECIPNKFPELKNSVKKIYESPLIPRGSMIVHRGTGQGYETNRSYLSDFLCNDDSNYGKLRYNNIRTDIPGPLGIAPKNNILIENIFLKSLIEKLYREKKFCGMLTYHGTGGFIYSKLSNDDEMIFDDNISDEYNIEKYNKSVINRILTRSYQEYTKYKAPNGDKKSGYKIIAEPSLKDYDEVLKIFYPAILLIELSYMGGNPLGPYGDKENNYIPTIESNLLAANNFFKKCKYLKDAMYSNYILYDKYVSNEWKYRK